MECEECEGETSEEEISHALSHVSSKNIRNFEDVTFYLCGK